MDPHTRQQATQQRMEVINNTATSSLEEEEILMQEHRRFDNMLDDILKAESMDEINALIASKKK